MVPNINTILITFFRALGLLLHLLITIILLQLLVEEMIMVILVMEVVIVTSFHLASTARGLIILLLLLEKIQSPYNPQQVITILILRVVILELFLALKKMIACYNTLHKLALLLTNGSAQLLMDHPLLFPRKDYLFHLLINLKQCLTCFLHYCCSLKKKKTHLPFFGIFHHLF